MRNEIDAGGKESAKRMKQEPALQKKLEWIPSQNQ
jgi:hypothetical protein